MFCDVIAIAGDDIKNNQMVKYSFFINGISRACLQEVVRHEAAFSVKSTRYTLKELKAEDTFDWTLYEDISRSSKYLKFTGNMFVDQATIKSLENLRVLLNQGISNDILKYALPENYKTSLTMTIDSDKLDNFFKLRTDKSALWEIRELSKTIFNSLPDNHQQKYNQYFKESVPSEH